MVPKPIRDRLGLQPGEVLDVAVQDNGDIVMRRADQDVCSLKGMLHHRGRKPVTVEEMNRPAHWAPDGAMF